MKYEDPVIVKREYQTMLVGKSAEIFEINETEPLRIGKDFNISIFPSMGPVPTKLPLINTIYINN